MYFEFPEGATPISDCSGLIPEWVQTLNDLNRVEAENIFHAQRIYLRSPVNDPAAWFHISEFNAIHRLMFGRVWEWAGKQRKSVTSIGVKPGLISTYLIDLCADVISWLQQPVELTYLEKAARIHHRLVFIHPFENGNGRFSRLVADRCLLAWKCPYPTWPEDLNRDGSARHSYIQTLKAADQGDFEPLINFMQELGAVDPDLSELFRNNFYRQHLAEVRGIAKVKALLRRGSNPNGATSNGHGVLHLAVKLGAEEIIKLLVNAGAVVDIPDRSGLTPFQIAVSLGNKQVAVFLRSQGARPLSPPGIGYANYYNMFHRLPPD